MAMTRISGYSLKAKKGLGQHFLVDRGIILRIVGAADLDEGDTVLEIGAGTGTLTTHLAQRVRQVIAVEVDEEMLAPLHRSVSGFGNVRVVHGDILQQDLAALVEGRPYKVVANLPYYITSAVLRYLLEPECRPCKLVVTVQRQVAERIVGRDARHGGHARPGQMRMSLLAVSVQFYGQPRIMARIPAGAFRPVPAVDSAVVRVDVYDPLPWGAVNRAHLFQAARAGFAQSRKQLHNALTHNLRLPAEQVWGACEGAGVDAKRRAETLSIQEWVALSSALGPLLAGLDDPTAQKVEQ
jgi:16S rRNA (adenine1518-N6/adenine1519-N6)-dimethyltransferase